MAIDSGWGEIWGSGTVRTGVRLSVHTVLGFLYEDFWWEKKRV
jgi:hypothetical protein